MEVPESCEKENVSLPSLHSMSEPGARTAHMVWVGPLLGAWGGKREKGPGKGHGGEVVSRICCSSESPIPLGPPPH